MMTPEEAEADEKRRTEVFAAITWTCHVCGCQVNRRRWICPKCGKGKRPWHKNPRNIKKPQEH